MNVNDFEHRPDFKLTAYCSTCRRPVSVVAQLTGQVPAAAIEQYRGFILRIHNDIFHKEEL